MLTVLESVQYIENLSLKSTNKYKHTSVRILLHKTCFLLGAVHRFYESRRILFNDAKPSRQQQVLKNSLLIKMKGYQKRICMNYFNYYCIAF